MSYTITKGIKRIDGCEDFELCGVDSIGCKANLSVSFNDRDEIVKVKSVSSSEIKDWPCINDLVCWSNGNYNGVVESVCGGYAWVRGSDGEFNTLCIKKLQKPKTPEEALRDDIRSVIFKKHAELVASIHVRESIIKMAENAAEILINEFDIKRKPR